MVRKIQVLGPGCPRCDALAANADAAARAEGMDFTLEKVHDIQAILDLGVMTTPALIVDGEVKVVGKVPDVPALRVLLR